MKKSVEDWPPGTTASQSAKLHFEAPSETICDPLFGSKKRNHFLSANEARLARVFQQQLPPNGDTERASGPASASCEGVLYSGRDWVGLLPALS